MKIEEKLWPWEGEQGFKKFNLVTKFLTEHDQIQTWPRHHQDKHSGKNLSRLKQDLGL